VKTNRSRTALALAGVLGLAFTGAVPAADLAIDLSKETPGKEPASFLPVVGVWTVAEDAGRKVVRVDGREWKRGQPAGGLADKARAIYGSRHEEFLDNVKAFAYFPYAVAAAVPDFTNGELAVRFRMVGGQLDQCGGILFDLKPNGNYFAVRFNGKEDNLVLWTFVNGKRSFVKKGSREVPLTVGTWHEIRVAIHGTELKAALDGEPLIDYTLPAPVSGKVGLWSKTDSITDFDAFSVKTVAQN
jgi:hypothetical protein